MSRKERINQFITKELNPVFLDIVNESNQHNVPEGSETHFKLTVVSNKFNDLTKIARHRLLNSLLADELKMGLHALSLHLYTLDEWQQAGGAIPNSPACKGGFRHG